ncbi:MAG TPA: AI-2E family transporter [Thermoleophilaceae bacterium]|jgi:predicted PurR-regulated permease PerM
MPDDEPRTEPQEQRMAPPRVVVPRWIQLVSLPLLLLVLWAAARAAGPVLLVFVVAGIIAIVLNPVVHRIETHLPRGLAIAVVYFGMVGALVAGGILLADPVDNQIRNFRDSVPGYVDDANHSLDDLQDWLDRKGVDLQVKSGGQSALDQLEKDVLARSGDIVSFTSDLVKTVITGLLALVLVIVISVYMLIYGHQIGASVRRVMPPGDGTPEDDFPTRVERAVAGYIRGQLLFSVIMGTSATIVLYILGVLGIFEAGKTYAVFFGVFYGFMELIPFIGPILGAAPPALVALFQDPLTAVWVVLAFVALQQLEGHVVAPNVFSRALRINPLIVIFALLFGGELYGIIGALVSLPVAAMLRETIIYLREHLRLEPWPAAAAGVPPGLLDDETTYPCPSCGEPATAADRYCSNCGESLETGERDTARA